jgi:hypothetical protein
MHQELAKAWYRKSVFDIRPDAQLFKKMVIRDRWNLGFNPLLIMQHITMEIDFDITKIPWTFNCEAETDKLVDNLLVFEHVVTLTIRLFVQGRTSLGDLRVYS